MKKHLITFGLCLAVVGFAQAQTDGATFETNQYGQRVESFPLDPTVQNGITNFQNKQKGYRFWFDSRVQVDFANYHNQQNGTLLGPEGSGGVLTNENSKPHMPGGISLRRVRFAVKAEVNKDWYGEVDFNMANGIFGLQDAFIQYNGLDKYGLQFKLGNFKEDFSMEYTTSSRYVTFMERAMCISAFNFTRRLGLQAQWQQLDWLRISAGITGQEIDGWELRHNIEENMKRRIRGSGPNLTGKVVLMPWGSNPDQGLHIGYNVQHRSGRWFSDDVTYGDANVTSWQATRVDSRNATAVNRTKYLDTRWINGVRSNVYHGFEFAGYYEGFRFGTEFIMNNVVMDEKLFPYANTPISFTGPNADALRAQYAETKKFHGWYFQTGYLLFGGKQRYDLNQSEFTQPTRGQKWGDLEVLFRYDYLDLNNDRKDENLMAGPKGKEDAGNARGLGEYQLGGSGHNFTFGLTYWINSNIRFTANYMISQNDVFANGGGQTNPAGRRFTAVGRNAAGQYTGNPYEVVENPGVRFNTLQMRLEIAF
jgi:phosphate-selective porin OprO/OprP